MARRRLAQIIGAWVFSLVLVLSAGAGDFIFLTDPLPPFNYEKDDRIQGITVDILKELMARTGNPLKPHSIMMVPWARGYRDAQEQPGTALFSVARTPQREKLFKWVGPIHAITIGLIGRQGVILDSLRDIDKYVIGSVKDSAPEQLLMNEGVPVTSLKRLASPVLNIRKLSEGRIDLFAHVDMASAYLMEGEGLDPNDYRMSYPLKVVHLYVAFHKDTDDALIDALNNALEELKAPEPDGQSEYRSIIHRHVKSGGLSLAAPRNNASIGRTQ